MATRASTLTGAGPVVRPLLISLWLAAVAVVLATVVAAALMAGRVSTSSTVPGNGPAVSKTDTGPGAPAHKPFRVNGNICAQCR